jgi:hypothetical protein
MSKNQLPQRDSSAADKLNTGLTFSAVAVAASLAELELANAADDDPHL